MKKQDLRRKIKYERREKPRVQDIIVHSRFELQRRWKRERLRCRRHG